jgi:ABC-type branched-subunit amino acid transport system permease subunit
MWGPILGAGVLTVLPQVLRFAAVYRFALYGLSIVLVILLRPQGLLTRVPTGARPRVPFLTRPRRIHEH